LSNIQRIRVLQALRLKGRVQLEPLAAASGISENDCAAVVDELTKQGLVEEARGRLKLTAAGREQLADQLARERDEVDQSAIATLYHAFGDHNSALKTLVTRWQLLDENTPNDHTDAAYDQAVIDNLEALDAQFQPLLLQMVQTAPRLAHYPDRFTAALNQVRGGDHSWFAKPLADSYHTVWFELHEDLIGLAGLSRAEEAAAGRAQ
jgi:DNA-binding MarR family transcriptional regulator